MRELFPAMLMAVTLMGCSPGTSLPTANIPSLDKEATAVQSVQRTRPVDGACETELAPPVVVGPGVIQQVDAGQCQLSHLGRSDFLSDKIIQLMAGTQTTQATFTAANGDVLHAVGSGTNDPIGPGLVRFAATLTFVGGTGRFTGATGEARIEGESNLVSRRASLTLTGSIAYDASERSGR